MIYQECCYHISFIFTLKYHFNLFMLKMIHRQHHHLHLLLVHLYFHQVCYHYYCFHQLHLHWHRRLVVVRHWHQHLVVLQHLHYQHSLRVAQQERQPVVIIMKHLQQRSQLDLHPYFLNRKGNWQPSLHFYRMRNMLPLLCSWGIQEILGSQQLPFLLVTPEQTLVVVVITHRRLVVHHPYLLPCRPLDRDRGSGS